MPSGWSATERRLAEGAMWGGRDLLAARSANSSSHPVPTVSHGDGSGMTR
jgi:hypothetical protein